VKVGIALANFSWPVPVSELGPVITGLARQADEAGFDSLWVMDHFFQIRLGGLPPESPMPEAYATLGVLAGQTRRLRLGTLVTSVAYRHPGVLLKTLTTLDVLSGGRMYLGIGAGAPFNPRRQAEGDGQDPVATFEMEGLGIPFPSLADRFAMLEEFLQVARQMWDGDETPFNGRHYQLARPLNSPNSVQRPRPPILIAGGGERKTLRLVAAYADACHLPDLAGTPYEIDFARKLDVLRRHCDDAGRDYAAIEKTTSARVADGAAAGPALLARLHEVAALGFDHAIVVPVGPWSPALLDSVAAVLPEARALGA
jgi:alkanesulfonate monooxygenase SsuD/methylene tetrahydromethanopterin reductase-like flavin-dependent oxidoreductase (luciferase family)